MKDIVFVTGNPEKAANFAKHIGMDIAHQPAELDEIQSPDPRKVVEHKVRQAYEQIGRPVLVEDTCMGLDELGGLPGTFIKFFIEQENGAENICRMADGLASRRATATVTFGYYDGERLEVFQDSIGGEIALHPGQAIVGFGWDVAFVPDGYGGRIRSELSEAEYDELYLRLKPFAKVREFLQEVQQ